MSAPSADRQPGPARCGHRVGRRSGEPRQRRPDALRSPHQRCLTARRGAEPRQRRSGALRAPHLRCLTVRRGAEPRERRSDAVRSPHLRCLTVRRGAEPRQRRSGALRAPHLRCLTVRRGRTTPAPIRRPARTASTVFNGETGVRRRRTPLARRPRTPPPSPSWRPPGEGFWRRAFSPLPEGPRGRGRGYRLSRYFDLTAIPIASKCAPPSRLPAPMKARAGGADLK